MAEIKRITELYDLHKSHKRVARDLGISKNTVKRYINRVNDVREGRAEDINPENRQVKQPARVLTPEICKLIHAYLESNLEKPKKQRLTAKRILALLLQAGHKIGYTSVKDEVNRWKSQHGPREVFILQEPKAGARAEFDWGVVNLTIGGICQDYSLASIVLPYSLYRFGRLYPRETQQEVIHAHIEFFKEIDAVPQTIFYDRMATVYDSKQKQINNRFMEFSLLYGVTPCVCNPHSPQEKGTDEESIGYIRKAAFSEKTSFETLVEANAWLYTCISTMNNQPVYRRDLVPSEGLKREREHMGQLPVLEYTNYELKRCRISRYSFAACDTNRYSVPDTYRGRDITLKVQIDKIELLDGDTVIATHPRLSGKGQYSLQISHFVKTLHKKPGAIRNAKVLKHMEAQLQNLFDLYYKNNPKEFLPILDLIKATSERALCYAVELLMENDMAITVDTLRFFINQQPYQLVEPLNFPSNFQVNELDLQVYDRLMEG
jgi:transposase